MNMIKNLVFGLLMVASGTICFGAGGGAYAERRLPSPVVIPSLSCCPTPTEALSDTQRLIVAIEAFDRGCIAMLVNSGVRLSTEEYLSIWNVVSPIGYIAGWCPTAEERVAYNGLCHYDYLLDYDELKTAIRENNHLKIGDLLDKSVYISPCDFGELSEYRVGWASYINLVISRLESLKEKEEISFWEGRLGADSPSSVCSSWSADSNRDTENL